MAKSHKFHPAPAETIAKLRRLLQDEYCQQHMNKSVVTGFLGELLVGALMQSAGHEVEHYGGQHGSDLRVPKLKVAIDVKTSTLKTELGVAHWGWALQSGSKKKAVSFTHVVCVALDDAFELSRFFVLRAADLERFPVGISPFKNNKRILLVTQDPTAAEWMTVEQAAAVQLCTQHLKDGLVRAGTDAVGLEALLRS